MSDATVSDEAEGVVAGPATLVIHPGALGDVLQAVPALRALGREGSVAFSGQPRLGALLRGLDLVRAHIPFDGFGFEALFTREAVPTVLGARLASYRRVISWFGSGDDVYPERLRSVAPECVIAPPVPQGGDARPVWRHLLATIATASDPGLVAPLDLPAEWRRDARRTLAGLGAARGQPLLVVHPGAGGRWKLWPARRMTRVVEQVIDATGAQVLIHEGPADRDAVDHLLQIIARPVPRLVQPELPLLAAVLASASAYLGGDSGVSHLAAAAGAPAVILFPEATRERWAPWSATAHVLAMGEEESLDSSVAAALGQRIRASQAPAE